MTDKQFKNKIKKNNRQTDKQLKFIKLISTSYKDNFYPQ